MIKKCSNLCFRVEISRIRGNVQFDGACLHGDHTQRNSSQFGAPTYDRLSPRGHNFLEGAPIEESVEIGGKTILVVSKSDKIQRKMLDDEVGWKRRWSDRSIDKSNRIELKSWKNAVAVEIGLKGKQEKKLKQKGIFESISTKTH